jgi:selenide,water dikinase
MKFTHIRRKYMSFDLLSTVEYGGCSAKLSAEKLSEALAHLPKVKNDRLLVDIETHDDAGVYKISDTCALIQTTDFFPPICSDPYEFGQIAASNALSDVYAMGGAAINAMNIVLFPSNRIPLDVLAEILKGGQSKVAEADAVIVGGHTIDDYPPKYGLAVTGIIHPEKIITNAKAKPGDILILTKPIGSGIIVAGKRINVVGAFEYQTVLDSMKLLNKKGAEIMQKYNVKSATDITGFGLLGHALKMAKASDVSFIIHSTKIPIFDQVSELADLGCLPGAGFRNQEYAGKFCNFDNAVDYNKKMILFDAQTSGGLFMAAPAEKAPFIIEDLQKNGYPQSSMVGRVIEKSDKPITID